MLQSMGRAIRRAARTIEVVTGVAMIAVGLYAFKEIVDILRGLQPVGGTPPGVALTLLGVACLVLVTSGVHTIRKGF